MHRASVPDSGDEKGEAGGKGMPLRLRPWFPPFWRVVVRLWANERSGTHDGLGWAQTIGNEARCWCASARSSTDVHGRLKLCSSARGIPTRCSSSSSTQWPPVRRCANLLTPRTPLPRRTAAVHRFLPAATQQVPQPQIRPPRLPDNQIHPSRFKLKVGSQRRAPLRISSFCEGGEILAGGANQARLAAA